jgi:hypothetical protein
MLLSAESRAANSKCSATNSFGAYYPVLTERYPDFLVSNATPVRLEPPVI